jgi:predicted dehydrogenase
MPKEISVGLVGLGSFGSAFADLFRKHPLVKRIALCDLEPERIKRFADRKDWRDKFHQRDAYSSLDDICRSDLDALVIITQPWLHAPQCIAALEAGKHVYSAVPIMCIPDGEAILEWCDRLVETVKRTGLHYMLGETTYYHPDAMYCRRRAAAGDFGHFVYSEGEYYHAFNHPASDLRQVRTSRLTGRAGEEWHRQAAAYRERELFDAPMHYPTHSTSGPMSVMGAHAVKVCCWGYEPRTDDPFFSRGQGSFSNETALFLMSNGTTMRICEHRETSLIRETFRVYGTKGSYEENKWITIDGTTHLTDDEMRDPLPPEVAQAWWNPAKGTVDYGGHKGSHAYLVHEFVDAVANDRIPAINVWQAVRYMAAGVMAHQSALRDGELLTVPDWGDPPA